MILLLHPLEQLALSLVRLDWTVNWLGWYVSGGITALTLFRGDDANLHHLLYFVWHCRGACMYTLETFYFQNIHINTFWKTFMVAGDCNQILWPLWHSTLFEYQNFLVRTLQNWMCYKIKSLDSFSLKLWHNTHSDDAKMLKNEISKKFEILNLRRNPDFSRFCTRISR